MQYSTIVAVYILYCIWPFTIHTVDAYYESSVCCVENIDDDDDDEPLPQADEPKNKKKIANEPKQCIAKKTKIGRCKYSKDLRIYFRFLIIQALEHFYSNLKNSKPTASKKEE